MIDIKPGDRIQTHPATDAWMRGLRYGTVTKVTKRFVHCDMDRMENIVRFNHEDVMPV